LLGVLLAVDAVVSHLKSLSRNVTTPEEIAQVTYRLLASFFSGTNSCRQILSNEQVSIA
jgi:hypothetical protein